LGDMGFAQVVAIIKACAVSGSGGSALNEDMIKAGLSNYIKQQLDFLDKGLKIIQSEVQISPESRPDFIAKDSSGRKVLVECKREGTASATDQLLWYNKAYGGKTRMFLVAFHFDDECMKSAKKRGIETIQATIVPKRLF
jgi:RecB family endonuclease NucS